MDEKNRDKTAGKDNKKGYVSVAGDEQLNKSSWSMSDGLLLVVIARINGYLVRALIDSIATRCFVTPACVTVVGLCGVC